MGLESLTFELEGVKLHVSTSLEGKQPLYHTSAIIESPSGIKKDTGLRYDADKGVFLDYLGNIADGLPIPNIPNDVQNKFRMEISEVFTFLARNGYITFPDLKPE